jgi:hypothetical protein
VLFDPSCFDLTRAPLPPAIYAYPLPVLTQKSSSSRVPIPTSVPSSVETCPYCTYILHTPSSIPPLLLAPPTASPRLSLSRPSQPQQRRLPSLFLPPPSPFLTPATPAASPLLTRQPLSTRSHPHSCPQHAHPNARHRQQQLTVQHSDGRPNPHRT